MDSRELTLMLDTNILIDYFDGTRHNFDSAVELVLYAISYHVPLLVAPSSLKDFYYIAQQTAKDELRRKAGVLTKEAACSAEEFAWGCVQSLIGFTTVVSQGLIDVSMAKSLHKLHRDFEDDLLLAAAMRCEVSYLVTNDKRLAAKSPVPALSAADTLLVLRG